jgi:hypothetical protein
MKTYGKDLFKVTNVMNINKMCNINFLIISLHDSNKSIITTCIAKNGNAYVQYNDFGIYPLYSCFKIIFSPK